MMSPTREDLDNMTLSEALGYLRSRIRVHELGIRYCKQMLGEYGNPK